MSGGTYELYGRPNSGSLAVQIVLEELGVPYALHWVGRSAADLEQFRRINPTGKIPALALPDGAAIFESAAILVHLTNAHPEGKLAPTPGTTAHARFLQWMAFLSANVYEAVLRIYYPERYSKAGAAAAADVKDQAVGDYMRHLGVIQEVLLPYVLGATFSAADIYLYVLAGWYPDDASVPYARLPKLANHAHLLRSRPATRKADEAHAEK